MSTLLPSKSLLSQSNDTERPAPMLSSLGLDFGTNSVRALLVDVTNGNELGVGVADYPSGTQGVLLDPQDHHLARQNPADYFYAMTQAIRAARVQASTKPGFSIDHLVGIGVDTTGSSPIPVDANNQALAMDPHWKNNPNAQCWLWKDHTSHIEAAEITRIAAKHRPHYLTKCGNTYSSEWFWSKIWHCLNVAPNVFDAAFSWVEFADWIPSVLAGIHDPREIRRGVCIAGHKAMYSDEWDGLPDKAFLALLDPKLASLRDRLYSQAFDASQSAGVLSLDWANQLGLPAGIPIAIGEMDVHYGAIGSGVVEGTLVKVMGTSTCDCCVVPSTKSVADIPGICGIVKGSILPGYYGIEAGQSAVGDIFKWWVEGICEGDKDLHVKLTEEASRLHPGQSGLLALDWNNGNRTILVDPMLTGLLLGQTLYTNRAEIYRALIEATAFGARMIVERLRAYGVEIHTIICTGGIAEKNPLVMQIYADVMGCPIHIAGSSQTCALGAAISAAVQAEVYPDFSSAQKAMTSLKEVVYKPTPHHEVVYHRLYTLYQQVHDAFGGVHHSMNLSKVMKDLIAIKTCNQAATPSPTS